METIAAISTPRGEGGIALIRLSGDGVFSVAEKVFYGLKKPSEMAGYTCAFGHITDSNAQIIDECVLTVFRAPHSYTGEDVVEISVHGGDFTAKKTLSLLIQNGARAARAGEFTERAVLSGKMNLTQAEAVIDIIKARTENELKFANAMKNGVVFRKIEAVKTDLINLAAEIGASDDYPDDYGEIPAAEIISRCDKNLAVIESLTRTYAAGSLIRSGIPVAIKGKPNAGKSSILNLFTGTERSIVTDIPGTTRDIVEGYASQSGYTLKLIDTAGLRETDDKVETIGVSRALETAKTAAITLAVFDLSRGADENDELTKIGLSSEKTVVIFNKTDAPRSLSESFINELEAKLPCVYLCAKSGNGIEDLRAAIGKIIDRNFFLPDTEVVLNERQFFSAQAAHSALLKTKEAAADGVSSDIYSVLLSEAVNYLLELTGESLTETVTNDIFSRFCVGK
jgi:tRNA modification GTPase